MDWLTQIMNEIDKFFFAMDSLSKQQKDIIGISVIAVGAMFCFLGFRLFKYLIGLAGFMIGSIIGLNLFYYIPWVNTMGEMGQLVVAAILGAIGAVSFFFLFYYFGVFVFGAVSAMWLGLIFLPRIEAIGDYRLLIVLGLGFIGGVLAFLMRKMIVIIATSAIGAVFIIMGIGHFYQWPLSATTFSLGKAFSGEFFENIIYHNDGVVIIALTIFFLIAGLFVQRFTSRSKDEDKENNK